MKRVEDERIQFFLRHHRLIRQWAAIESEVREVINEFLQGFANFAENKQYSATDSWKIYQNLDNSRPTIIRFLPEWVEAEGTQPRAGIALKWYKKSVNLLSTPHSPFIGVWVNPKQRENRILQDRLQESWRHYAKAYDFSSEIWWPAYKYIPPRDEEFWKDLETYRTLLEEEFEQTWELFAPIVSETLSGSPQ
jgi:hypothetical protein